MEAVLKQTRFFVLLIIFIGLLLYAKGLINGFVGDDELQILNNIKVHSINNIPSFFVGSTYENGGADFLTGIFYRPIMMSVFSIIYFVFGSNPMGFHLIQLLFHISNTILLFIFLRRFFPNLSAFLVSLVFLVHPINSETVLYSANLQEVLFFFFGIISLLLISNKNNKHYLYFVPFTILFSLFSKESGILFIIVGLIYAYLFSKSQFKFLLISLPSMLGIYLFARFVLAHMWQANNSLAPITHAPLLERLINIPKIIIYYLTLFFFPKDMTTYQFWIVKIASVNDFWLPLLLSVFFFILILSGFVWIYKKHKTVIRVYLFFCVWFLIGLLLHIQILPLDATVADRWFYFPIVGILGMIAILISQLKIMKITLSKQIAVGLIILIAIVLSMRTFIRISDWQSDLTLFDPHGTKIDDFISQNSYAAALINDGQFEKAKPYTMQSISIHPFSVNLNNLAIIYVSENNIPKADENFQKAIAIGQNLTVYENYANYLLFYKNPQKALEFSKRALIIFPQSSRLLLTLAQSEYLQNNKEQALKDVIESYKINPDDKTAEILLTIQKNKPLLLKH
jgi:protein O-mannosyl-transferase